LLKLTHSDIKRCIFSNSFEIYDDVGSARSGAVVTSVKYPREAPYRHDWAVMSVEDSPGGPPLLPDEVEGSPQKLPQVKGYEEFLILSSTKQNVELYKILRAISNEIQSLKVSVETRLSDLETLITDDASKDDVTGHHIVGVIPKNPDKSLKLFASDGLTTVGGPDESILDESTPMFNGPTRTLARKWPMPPPTGDNFIKQIS